LQSVLTAIESAICTAGIGNTFVANSNCINLSGLGTSASPITATPRLDSIASNMLSCSVNGLYSKLTYTNSGCITLAGTGTPSSPFTAVLNLGTGLQCVGNVLSVTGSVTANNGLTATTASNITTVKLGGALTQNTSIDLTSSNYTFTVTGQTGDYLTMANSGTTFFYTEGLSANNYFTKYTQVDQGINLIGDQYTNVSNPNYNAISFIGINPFIGASYLGSYFPIGTATYTQQSATFVTSLGRARTEAFNIEKETVTRTIGSGTLINGKKYIITAAGGNFTSSGASANTVGTIFTANSVAPVWGSGAVQTYGTIADIANTWVSELSRGGLVIVGTKDPAVNTITPGVNDLGYISVTTDQYTEQQIYSSVQRAAIGYRSQTTFVQQTGGSTTGIRYVKTGVNVPGTTSSSVPAPADDQYSSYTTWQNNPGSSVQGTMSTISPIVTYIGVSGVNLALTKMGLNATTPTTTLDIVGPTTAAAFRIRTAYTPTTSAAAGNIGDISWDTNYLYIYTGAAWKRIALTTF
jgi:hypothetical protein